MAEYPRMLTTVLDATDVRSLAEFYRNLLGLRYRPGDEVPADGEPDDADWLVLTDEEGHRRLSFQRTDELPRSTWPAPDVPQQLHIDYAVSNAAELERQRERALALGATVRFDRSDDENEPLYVFTDPAGHPFCILVG